MKSKLTLNIDKEITVKAKAYAKSQGRSLSDLVENLLKTVTKDHDHNEFVLTPRVKRLAGSLDHVGEFNYKEELQKIIFEKYSGNEENIS